MAWRCSTVRSSSRSPLSPPCASASSGPSARTWRPGWRAPRHPRWCAATARDRAAAPTIADRQLRPHPLAHAVAMRQQRLAQARQARMAAHGAGDGRVDLLDQHVGVAQLAHAARQGRARAPRAPARPACRSGGGRRSSALRRRRRPMRSWWAASGSSVSSTARRLAAIWSAADCTMRANASAQVCSLAELRQLGALRRDGLPLALPSARL